MVASEFPVGGHGSAEARFPQGRCDFIQESPLLDRAEILGRTGRLGLAKQIESSEGEVEDRWPVDPAGAAFRLAGVESQVPEVFKVACFRPVESRSNSVGSNPSRRAQRHPLWRFLQDFRHSGWKPSKWEMSAERWPERGVAWARAAVMRFPIGGFMRGSRSDRG